MQNYSSVSCKAETADRYQSEEKRTIRMTSEGHSGKRNVWVEVINGARQAYSCRQDGVKLLYSLEGVGEAVVNGESLLVRARTGLLIGPGAKCTVHTTDKSKMICLSLRQTFFHQHLFHEIWEDRTFSEFITWTFEKRPQAYSWYVCDNEQRDGMRDLLLAILHEFASGDSYSKYSIDYCIFLAFIRLSRGYMNKYGNNLRGRHLECIQLYDYINNNYQTVTLNRVANYFHFSPAHISRFLKKTTGKSFIKIVQEKRLSAADHLLRRTDMSVSEIAYECGYQNVSFFYRIFKKEYGSTPHEYRKYWQTEYKNRKMTG